MLTLPRMLLGAALLAATACSSEPVTDSGQGGSSANDGGASGSGGEPNEPRLCPEGPFPISSAAPREVGVVSGRVVDEDGQPVPNGEALVQVCGKDICENVDVSGTGAFSKAVSKPLDTPACKFGSGLAFGKLAFQLDAGDTDVGNLAAVRLPAFEAGAPLVPGETASSGGVSLELLAGASVNVDLLVYSEPSQHGFRAAPLTPALLARLDQDFALAFALSPLETRICPSPKLSVENTLGLAPGTELELFALGLSVAEEWVPYASWAKMADGSVSADGSTLEFPEGVPVLTAIGIREKP